MPSRVSTLYAVLHFETSLEFLVFAALSIPFLRLMGRGSARNTITPRRVFMAPRHNEAQSIAYRIYSVLNLKQLLQNCLRRLFIWRYVKVSNIQREPSQEEIQSLPKSPALHYDLRPAFISEAASKCQPKISSNGDCSQLPIYARGQTVPEQDAMNSKSQKSCRITSSSPPQRPHTQRLISQQLLWKEALQ